MGPLLTSYRTRYLQTDEKDPEFLTCLLYPDKALLCNESGPSLCLNHPCMSCLSFEALGQHFHSKLKIASAACIGRFQAIKTDVLLIFSFITGDKTEFLSPMMFSNEYITGI